MTEYKTVYKADFNTEHSMAIDLEWNLHSHFPDKLIKADGRKKDFLIKDMPAEVKIEARKLDKVISVPILENSLFNKEILPTIKCSNMERNFNGRPTKNFFMEVFSDLKKRTPGGPFQSLKNGTHIYFHWFIPTRNLFFFNTGKLVQVLNKPNPMFRVFDVPNRTYTSQGLIVPVDAFKYKTTVKKDVNGDEWSFSEAIF
jgi:hypothetical protein